MTDRPDLSREPSTPWRNISERWEARSALRWGSKHRGYFATEAEARAFAEQKITEAGGVGRIENVVGRCVYFDEHEEMA